MSDKVSIALRRYPWQALYYLGSQNGVEDFDSATVERALTDFADLPAFEKDRLGANARLELESRVKDGSIVKGANALNHQWNLLHESVRKQLKKDLEVQGPESAVAAFVHHDRWAKLAPFIAVLAGVAFIGLITLQIGLLVLPLVALVVVAGVGVFLWRRGKRTLFFALLVLVFIGSVGAVLLLAAPAANETPQVQALANPTAATGSPVITSTQEVEVVVDPGPSNKEQLVNATLSAQGWLADAYNGCVQGVPSLSEWGTSATMTQTFVTLLKNQAQLADDGFRANHDNALIAVGNALDLAKAAGNTEAFYETLYADANSYLDQVHTICSVLASRVPEGIQAFSSNDFGVMDQVSGEIRDANNVVKDYARKLGLQLSDTLDKMDWGSLRKTYEALATRPTPTPITVVVDPPRSAPAAQPAAPAQPSMPSAPAAPAAQPTLALPTAVPTPAVNLIPVPCMGQLAEYRFGGSFAPGTLNAPLSVTSIAGCQQIQLDAGTEVVSVGGFKPSGDASWSWVELRVNTGTYAGYTIIVNVLSVGGIYFPPPG